MPCSLPLGFLPCADNLGGSIFLLAVYGLAIRQGLTFLNKGALCRDLGSKSIDQAKLSLTSGTERLLDTGYIPKHIAAGASC